MSLVREYPARRVCGLLGFPRCQGLLEQFFLPPRS
jgi:hypothetical protein